MYKGYYAWFLNNLSDGVFAMALTLLAFDLRLPEGIPIGDLPNNLLKLAPKFMVYLISFVVIAKTCQQT
jgi:uncharacterized membrane protein